MLRVAAGLGASLIVHAIVAGVIAARAGAVTRSKPRIVPLEIVEAPAPPPPPEPPPPEPEQPAPERSQKKPVVKAKPKPKPKPVVPVTTTKDPADKPDVALPTDAGVADAPPPADAGPPVADAGVPTEDAGLVAQNPSPGADAGVAPPARPVDPGTLDLRAFVPRPQKVMLAIRTDRLRDTPWAPHLDAILAPMPDYRLIIAGTGVGVADTFETLVIATPDPGDMVQTFVAARTKRDEAAIRRALAGPGGAARVTWSQVAGGVLGRRTDPLLARHNDTRVFLIPYPSWFVLARAEHVADMIVPTGAPVTRPAWLDKLALIDEQTGDGATIVVVVLADLGSRPLSLPVLGAVEPPERLTLAMTADPKGIVLTGVAACADEAKARAFHAAVTKGQADAMGSFSTKFVLRQLSVEGVVRRLTFLHRGSFVSFSSSLTHEEADKLFKRAAQLTQQYFLRPRAP